MPQVTFHPLPVLQEGEGLEEEDENDNAQNVTVNFVTGEDSWTLVQRRKKNKKDKNNKNEKWNAQQLRNFLTHGDIYRGEPYKSYRNVNVGPPVANVPLQQQVGQPPIVQINQPAIPLPAPVQLPPVIAVGPPPPGIAVAPPPNPAAPGGQFNPKLEAIPEEDEEEEAEPQGAGYRSRSSSSASSSPPSLTPEASGTPRDTPDR